MKNQILEAYQQQLDEYASKGDNSKLYVELYNFIRNFNVTELNQAGQTIGLQTANALTEAFDMASKHDKKAFIDAVIKELKKIKV